MNERERFARVKEMFLAVKEAAPDRRDALLEELSDGDPTLRAEVEALLAHDSGSGPLDVSPSEAPGSMGTRERPGFRGGTGDEGGELAAGRSRSSYPPELIARALPRLRTVALLVPAAVLFLWIVPVTLQGELVREFRQPHEWLPPVVAMVSSLLVYAALRAPLRPERVVDVGLVYLVVVSYALATSQYWTAFSDLPGGQIDFDMVGFSGGALWMLLHSILVPSRPRRALPFLLLAAAATPVVYLLAVRAGRAPPLEVEQFITAFVLPNLATVVFAYIAVRVVYDLGREVSRAREVGSYRLEALLGEGGMGRVWRASHRLLARPAAVKLIRPEALGGSEGSRAAALERFEREARITASLRSAHTVELYDFGVASDGSLYYVMELLEGMDLDEMVRRFGPLDPARAAHLARHACLSLGEAHARGLVHGDVKPANLFVSRPGLEDDVLKVLDFGLARRVRTVGADPVTPSGGDAPAALDADGRPRSDAGGDPGGAPRSYSGSGVVEGTPGFMAPEVASGPREPDARSDLYSLGCVLFWVLTGRMVFEAPSLAGMLRAHGTEEPRAPSAVRDGVPPELDALVLRCLAKEPGERFDSAVAVEEALVATGLADAWTRARARAWWAGVAGDGPGDWLGGAQGRVRGEVPGGVRESAPGAR